MVFAKNRGNATPMLQVQYTEGIVTYPKYSNPNPTPPNANQTPYPMQLIPNPCMPTSIN